MTAKRVGEMSRARRIALAVLGVASAAALTAGLVWLALAAKPAAEPPKQVRIEPAQETTEQAMPPVLPSRTATPAATPTPTAEATTPVSTEKPAREPGTKRAARIAYRLGGMLYVANEDGSAPRPVARIAEGPYALSPDALVLAFVAAGRMQLLDTTSGAVVDVGDATDVRPVWMPDSSAVLYVRRVAGGASGEVWRVTKDGSKDAKLHAGASVTVSPDGRVLAVLPDERPAQYVSVSVSGSKFWRVSAKGGSYTAVAAGNNRLYLGMAETSSTAWLQSMRRDGSGSKRLAGAPSGDVPAVWGDLCISPDGSRLGAVALGDDEYSRISIFVVPKGGETRLNPRRDGYARCWSSNGDYLYFVEGNVYQGESTVLYRVKRDGTGRRVVATGGQ